MKFLLDWLRIPIYDLNPWPNLIIEFPFCQDRSHHAIAPVLLNGLIQNLRKLPELVLRKPEVGSCHFCHGWCLKLTGLLLGELPSTHPLRIVERTDWELNILGAVLRDALHSLGLMELGACLRIIIFLRIEVEGRDVRRLLDYKLRAGDCIHVPYLQLPAQLRLLVRGGGVLTLQLVRQPTIQLAKVWVFKMARKLRWGWRSRRSPIALPLNFSNQLFQLPNLLWL